MTPAAISSATDASFVLAWLGALVAFQSFATVGAIVASRIPSNPIGWLYCACGLLCQLANAGGAYTDLSFAGQFRGGAFTGVLTENGPWADRRWCSALSCLSTSCRPAQRSRGVGAPSSGRSRSGSSRLRVVSILGRPAFCGAPYRAVSSETRSGSSSSPASSRCSATCAQLPAVALGVAAVRSSSAIRRAARARSATGSSGGFVLTTVGRRLCARRRRPSARRSASNARRARSDVGEFAVAGRCSRSCRSRWPSRSCATGSTRSTGSSLGALAYATLTVILGAAYVGARGRRADALLVVRGRFRTSRSPSSTLVVAALFLPVRITGATVRRPALLPAPLRRAAHARGIRSAPSEQVDLADARRRAARCRRGHDAARPRLGLAPTGAATMRRRRLGAVQPGRSRSLRSGSRSVSIGERRGLDLPPDRDSKLLVELVGGDRSDALRGGRLLIVRKEPRNPIGWIFLGSGLTLALTAVAYGYADLALYGGEGWVGASWAAWLGSWLIISVFVAPCLIAQLFPDGRALPGRLASRVPAQPRASPHTWRSVPRSAPGRSATYPTVDNPVGLPGPRRGA